jgi:hypothetical protein
MSAAAAGAAALSDALRCGSRRAVAALSCVRQAAQPRWPAEAGESAHAAPLAGRASSGV